MPGSRNPGRQATFLQPRHPCQSQQSPPCLSLIPPPPPPIPFRCPARNLRRRPTTRPTSYPPTLSHHPQLRSGRRCRRCTWAYASGVNPSPSTPSFPTPIGNPSPDAGRCGGSVRPERSRRVDRTEQGGVSSTFSLVASSLVGALPRCEAAHAEATRSMSGTWPSPRQYSTSVYGHPPSLIPFRCPARNLGLAPHAFYLLSSPLPSSPLPSSPLPLPSTELEAEVGALAPTSASVLFSPSPLKALRACPESLEGERGI